MGEEIREPGFTAEQWDELDKELAKYVMTGFICEWGMKKSTDPVELYLEQTFGVVKKIGYRDVDFRENKLMYLTVDYIYNRQEYDKLESVNFDVLLEMISKIRQLARFCPGCNLYRISRTKRECHRRYEKLEEICEKYLRSIGVWEQYC